MKNYHIKWWQDNASVGENIMETKEKNTTLSKVNMKCINKCHFCISMWEANRRALISTHIFGIILMLQVNFWYLENFKKKKSLSQWKRKSMIKMMEVRRCTAGMFAGQKEDSLIKTKVEEERLQKIGMHSQESTGSCNGAKLGPAGTKNNALVYKKDSSHIDMHCICGI